MPDWILVGKRAELEERKVITVRASDRPVAVFWNEGEPLAVDNRCPHMGFPLDKGSVKDGILTCHWHHARFALKGGCAFDLFADDVPYYDIKVTGEDVEVASDPASNGGVDYLRARLRRGMEQNLSLIQAKSIVGMRHANLSTKAILREIVDFGSESHDEWRDGMTLVSLMGQLDETLDEETRVHGLAWAASRVANNCAGQPRRRERGRLDNAEDSFERLQSWFKEFVMMRHRDGAERALLTASAQAESNRHRQRILATGILQRVFADTGHLFDFANKALELGEFLDADAHALWPQILPLLVEEAVAGQGEEDKASWRSPTDLVALVKEAEKALPGIQIGNAQPSIDLSERFLGDDPERIVAGVVEALRSGVNPIAIARAIANAAAWRMARFSSANELGDWFNPTHTFIYSNAVVNALKRSLSPELLPALLHGAMAVYQDRFLNVPAAPYPAESDSPSEGVLDDLLESFNHAPDPRSAVERVVAFVRHGGSIQKLADRLSWAVIREDLDFHKLQTVEAAYQLSKDIEDKEARALLFAGATRYIAMHCPTPRARLKTTLTAIKLHRSGDPAETGS